MSTGKTESPLAVQIILAEFTALRQEISDRSTAQYTLVSLNLTAISAFGGFALSNEHYRILLLLLPILSPAMGMLYFDHAINIGHIGHYIGQELRVACDVASQGTNPSGYERVVRGYERKRWGRVVFGIPTLLMFAGIPAGALIYLMWHLEATWMWLLWALGAGLVLSFLASWCIFLYQPFRQPSAIEAKSC